jgi:hypothetical protein
MAKVNDGFIRMHIKSLYRLIKFVVEMKHYGLVIEPKEPAENSVWEMMACCDYSGNKDGRKVCYTHL